MKAISKLISVVLILALCLSIFTVSASATEIIVPNEDGTANYGGGIDEEEDNGEEDEIFASALTNGSAPADGSVKVADYAELDAALKAQAPAITLTAKVPVTGPLALDYAVKLNLGGTGCGLDFSGAGAAAVVSTAADVEITNGNLFVTGASSIDEDGNAVGGFLTVATGSIKMTGVHIQHFSGEDSVFGEGVNFVSGSSSQALHAGDVANAEGRFVYEVKQEIPEDKKDEKKDENLTDPVDSKPTDPVDSKPTDPVDPKPTDPVDPKPTDPVDPKPTDPVDPKPTDPVDPKPTDPVDPKPTDPVDPQPTDPVDPQPTDPVDPQPTDPVDPQPTDPVDPQPTDPVDPQPTDPVDPQPTDPVDPQPTDPVDPQPTDPVDPQPTDPVDPQPTDPVDPQPTDPVDPQPTEPVDPQPTEPADPQPATQETVIESSAPADLQTAEAAEQPAEPPVNEDPVTIEKPEEVVLKEEVRVDEAAQQAAEEEKTTLTATDDVTGAVVTVTGFLPEGLTLVVKHIDTGVIGGLAEDEFALLAVDISLVDAEGNEYEPVNNPDANFRAVSVMISHPSLASIAEDETLVLYHVEENGTSQVASASAGEGSDTMSFSTGSFSPFVIVVTKGPGTPNTGSDGEVHRKQIKITNLSGETYVIGSGNIKFRIEGGAAPESISIIDPNNVSSGNIDVYKAGYLTFGVDYDMSNYTYPTGPIQDMKKPVDIEIHDDAVKYAPTGKWAVVFWFKDTTDSGSTRVYMVQYVNIVPNGEIKGIGYNFDDSTVPGTYEVEKCDYDALEVLLTADLLSFNIVGADGITYANYNRNVNAKKMTVRINGKDKLVDISEYFTVSDYVTNDALGHEFVAGKTLKIHDALVKKLPYGDGHTLTVEQQNKDTALYPNYDIEVFRVNVTPGITVADGLTDYIKGRNTWIKFVACEPIDYDADGTLAIWIGGQKISHDYYSISNDHKTLWIYRNLLDQLKSNNSYTLTARLWGFVNTPTGKVKQTWYPATASFNILAAGSTSYRSPKTGDESNVALWAAVLVLSGGAVIALIPRKKKSK